MTDREALLSQWVQPSSPDEQTQQERAERMVTEAVKAHPPLATAGLKVYAKGSYPNNTNVRRDSDVDIAAQCTRCEYYEYMPGQAPAERLGTPYEGPWTPEHLRSEVQAALASAFGSSSVKSGKIALTVLTVSGSRPSVDVVPSFDYVLYDDPNRRSKREGSCVFPKGKSNYIVNWPMQQLQNGRRKNTNSGGRYKRFVRALKSAENTLEHLRTIDELPSYFMECLVWNVGNTTLQRGSTLSDGFRATLYELWDNLDNGRTSEWTEPNNIKYLFGSDQTWTPAEAKGLVLATWNYLDY
ncbi:MAG: nucleotidyltransferase [Actinomycetota bacterium]|nr:nucleotidyltransferase [Actinomycetota bacterium]